MNLLILTQAVDRNHQLGFFHDWIEEFSRYFTRVTVITLLEGDHDLPSNVRVLSLGKSEGKGAATRLWRLLYYTVLLRREYDGVFVHMNPEYFVACGALWKLMGKKTALWYLHKSVTWKLRLAVWCADYVFTAVSSGMRIATRKKIVTGHGIRLSQFEHSRRKPSAGIHALTVGRIAPAKNIELQIEALSLLAKRGTPVSLRIVGGLGVPEDAGYARELERRASQAPFPISFEGEVPHSKIGEYLETASVFLNTSRTGGVDKAVLEAMAAGIPVATTNTAFGGILDPVLIAPEEPAAYAACIEGAMRWDGESLREIVRTGHSLSSLIRKISSYYGAYGI